MSTETDDKRFILTLKNGGLEDVGAECVNFGPKHIVFTDKAGNLEYAIHADLVMRVEEEGRND